MIGVDLFKGKGGGYYRNGARCVEHGVEVLVRWNQSALFAICRKLVGDHGVDPETMCAVTYDGKPSLKPRTVGHFAGLAISDSRGDVTTVPYVRSERQGAAKERLPADFATDPTRKPK